MPTDPARIAQVLKDILSKCQHYEEPEDGAPMLLRDEVTSAVEAVVGTLLQQQEVTETDRRIVELLRTNKDLRERCEAFERIGKGFQQDSQKYFEQSCKNLKRAEAAEAQLATRLDGQTSAPNDLWILRHQILPNIYGLKYAALERVLTALETASPSVSQP